MKRFAGLRILSVLIVLAIAFSCMGTAMAASYAWYVRAVARTNLRSGPGVGYDDVGTLEKGEQVLYMNAASNDKGGVTWFKIQNYSRGTAWVSSVYTEIVVDEVGSAGVAFTEGTTTGSYVEGIKGNSNLRTGPGLGYKDIGTVHKGDIATYLNMSSVDERGIRWYKVFFEGQEGWVSSRYTELKEGTYAPGFNLDVNGKLFVKASARVNVRSGPGVSYNDIATLEKGEQVEWLRQMQYDKGGVAWYKIKYYSMGEGWVSSVYSSIITDDFGVAGVEYQETNVTGTYVVGTNGNSNLRSGPGLNYDDLGTVDQGESAKYLGSYSRDERGVLWYYVNFNGKTGWLSSRYTTLY